MPLQSVALQRVRIVAAMRENDTGALNLMAIADLRGAGREFSASMLEASCAMSPDGWEVEALHAMAPEDARCWLSEQPSSTPTSQLALRLAGEVLAHRGLPS